MVESQARAQPSVAPDRPSSWGYFVHTPQPEPEPASRDTSFASSGFSSDVSAGAGDNENITTPTLNSSQATPLSGHNTPPQNTVTIHASMDMSGVGHPSRPGSTRRRSRSQAVNQTQSSTTRTPHSPSVHGYPTSSTDTRHPTVFQGPPTYAAPSGVQYGHRPELLTQYTMSPPPGSMGMTHSPSYVYTPTFHPSMEHPQNIHGSYPSMMQSTPMYQYPASTVDHSSSPVASYSGSRSPSMYASPSPNTQPPGSSPHPMTSQQQGTTISGAFINTGSYQNMAYPSTPPYPYGYTSSYSRPPYPQTTQSEPQGTWVYLPHLTSLPSSQQYDTPPSFQTHYPVHFPQMGRSNVENQFPVSSSSQQHSTPPYSMLPNSGYRPHFSQSPSSSDVPQASSQATSGIHQRTSSRASSGSERSEHAPQGDRAVIRRPYHPNPPSHRSEWVMWAGNVPSDATYEELDKFFTQSPSDESSSGTYHSGVLSIFPISRSSCAFVNYDTEVTLLAAIGRFNGVPLRSHDPRCPRMVCRVRKKDDDLKAGVGGQRGMGMHTRWVKQQKGKARDSSDHNEALGVSDDQSLSPSASVSERLAYAMSSVSISSDEESRKPSSGSGSFTSTNSGFLVRYFPKRYFILKSLTQDDLDLSVERGVWATQKHNEGILEQAFRTSKEVFLIFSVNKSGEFYGYARMSGPVRRGEQTVTWASTAGSRSNHPSLSGVPLLASDGRQVDTSPLPLHTPLSSTSSDPLSHRVDHHASAPPLLGKRYRLPTVETPGATYSLDHRYNLMDPRQQPSKFELDRSAPVRAIRNHQPSTDGPQHTASPEPGDMDGQVPEARREESWGDCFSVEWLCTSRLPFHRTRHLRNPWNHDREVKVSRDGTELEPTIGQWFLDEWEKLADLSVPLPSGSGSGKPPASKKVSKYPQPATPPS